MVYRFLKTLKKTEVKSPREMPEASPLHLDRCRVPLHAASRQPGGGRTNRPSGTSSGPSRSRGGVWFNLGRIYQMLRKREGERLDTWRALVHESDLPE